MQEEFSIDESKNTIINKIIFFYKKNRTLVFSIFFLFFIIIISITYYFYSQEKKRILISDKYILAKIDLDNNLKDKAKNSLVQIIESNDKTYSPLSLFLIIDANLIKDEQKLVSYFDQISF